MIEHIRQGFQPLGHSQSHRYEDSIDCVTIKHLLVRYNVIASATLGENRYRKGSRLPTCKVRPVVHPLHDCITNYQLLILCI
jgi:hypothetical protein